MSSRQRALFRAVASSGAHVAVDVFESDEKKKLRGIGAAFGRLRRTAFHRNSVMMLLLLLLGGLLCVSYYRSIQWSQWRRGGLAPVSLHPAGDQADHPAPAD